mgnify:CR=1 FL=1
MVYGNFKQDFVDENSICDPIGIYGALKFSGEKIVIAYNQVFDIPYTIVRPSALYGERCVSRRVGQIFIENAIQNLDINKEVVNDKFWKNDNEVDNLNETLAVLNRMWTSMYRDFEDVNITASENPSLEPLIYDEKNILDGWALNFTIELPNTTLNLCVAN